MRKITRFGAALLLFTAAALHSSCISDRHEDYTGPTGNDEKVTFRINVPSGTQPRTRALDPGDEYAVEDVSVLVFNHDDSNPDNRTFKGRYTGRIVSGPTHTGGSSATMTFEVSLPASPSGKSYDLMITANAQTILNGCVALAEGQKQSVIEEALTKVMTTAGWNSATGDPDYMPMWGYVKGVSIPDDFPVSTVNLTRMVAKVDVQLNASVIADGNFELHEVRVYNYVEQGRLVPYTGGSFDWTAVTQANLANNQTPSLPAGYTKADPASNEYLGYTLASPYESLKNEIYLFEAPTGVTPASGGSDFLGNTCLVIGGKYNGGDITYYRIDFAKREDAGTVTTYTYLPILRNNSYTVTITGVSGDGYTSPDDALNSIPVNINVGILTWADGNMSEMAFDGQYYLGVSDKAMELDKSAQSVAMQVVTDYNLSPRWSYKICDADGKEVTGDKLWIKNVQATDRGAGVTDDFTFDAEENKSDQPRELYIHFSAARMTIVVKVEQGITEVYELKIIDPETGFEITELLFDDDGVSTVTEKFEVQWRPHTAEVKVVKTPGGNALTAGAVSPAIPDGQGYISWDSQGADDQHTYSATLGRLNSPDATEFYEESERYTFELMTPEGMVISKPFSVRHTKLELKTVEHTYLMNGKRNVLGVRANFPWRATLVKTWEDEQNEATQSSDRILLGNKFEMQVGNNNTTAVGDPLNFYCQDHLSTFNNTSPIRGYVKVKFERFHKGQWTAFEPNPTATVKCYSAVPVGQANSYMIDNNEPIPILIPVSQMCRAIGTEEGFLTPPWVENPDKLAVSVFWSDVQDGTTGKALIGTGNSVVNEVMYMHDNDLDNAKIAVVPGKGFGNSGIILYEDMDGNGVYNTGDRIRWSWHIWNTDYFPYDRSTYPGTNPVIKDPCPYDQKWMDRNIGAWNDGSTGDIKTIGFYYQWGRKDPFPGPASWLESEASNQTVWFADGIKWFKFLSYNDAGLAATPANNKNNLNSSVMQPMTFINGRTDSKNDWYMNGEITYTGNQQLWGGGAATKPSYVDQITGKSVYDPCPEGYKMPRKDDWTTYNSGWSLVKADQYIRHFNPTQGGYYNLSGVITGNYGRYIYISEYGYYWSRDLNYTTSSTALYLQYTGGRTTGNQQDRANGYVARCIAE